MADALNTEDDRLRRALFVHCLTREDLARWIRVYLGVDLPDCVVDPESNSTPLDVLWEMYDIERNGGDPDRHSFLFYAARSAFKTLALAISELLSVLHLERNVAHVAAIEQQAAKCADYLRLFLNRPYLADFVQGDNKRTLRIVRYQSAEGVIIPPAVYDRLTKAEKAALVKKENYFKILVATKQSLNSEHLLTYCVDELDLVRDRAAYEEGKMIPDVRDGQYPITKITSSRKFGFGLVQKEIDEAPKSGLQIRHWNLIDVTEACPPSRHRPEEPRVALYRSDSLLHTLDEATWTSLDPLEQARYVKSEAFAGCAKCRLYSACRGNLATRQKSRAKTLKLIPDTIAKFSKASVPFAQAQILSRKPETEGLIWPRFDRQSHVISAAYLYELIVGERPTKEPTKRELISLLHQRGGEFFAGMDFGYGHNFAVVVGCRFGAYMFILDAFQAPGLDPGQQISLCESRLKGFGGFAINPTVYPDVSAPGTIKLFKKAGFVMRSWTKGPGSVKDGIDAVSYRLWPTLGEPTVYLLEGDDGCELLAGYLSQYHYKLDAQGKPTDVPDDEDDDLDDAFRYLIQNTTQTGGVVIATDRPAAPAVQTHQEVRAQHEAQMWAQIAGKVGLDTATKEVPKKGRGRLCWAM